MPLWQVLHGKTIQTTKDGVLLELYGKPVFVRGFPYRYPDDTYISLLAVKGKVYTYIGTDGAERNVEGYDYGKVKKVEAKNPPPK